VLIACLMAALLTSCALSGEGTECSAFRPIYVSKADQFSDATARQILAHNEAWKSLCQR
jgi:hypothetical protein